MASELNLNEDKDELNQQGLMASSVAPGGASAQGQGQRQTPSGRPNVSQYIQANQGAGDKLSQGIQQRTQQQSQALSKDVATRGSQFESQVNPLSTKLGEEGSQRIQGAFKDPSAILAQQDQLDEFRRLQNRGYTQDIGNLGQTAQTQQQELMSKANQLGQSADLARTEGGRYQLLRQTFGQPNYSSGQQKLDQLFLQTQPGVNRGLQTNLGQVASQAGKTVGTLAEQQKARLDALAGLSDERSAQVAKLLSGGFEEGLEADISQRGLSDISMSAEQQLAQAQARAKEAEGIQDRLQSPASLTATDLKNLGINQLPAGSSVYDLNLNELVQGYNYNPTLAQAVDPQEFARYRALQQLAGDTSGDIFGGATEAGGYNPYQITTPLTQAISDARNKWENTKRTESVNNFINKMNLNKDPKMADIVNRLQSASTPEELQAYLNQAHSYGGQLGFDIQGGRNTVYLDASELQNYLKDVMKYRGNRIGVPSSNIPTAPDGYLPDSKYSSSPSGNFSPKG